MRIPKRITLRWLRDHNACWRQLNLFQQTFGESVELTVKSLARAKRAGLEIDWLVTKLTTSREHDQIWNRCFDLNKRRPKGKLFSCRCEDGRLRLLRKKLREREKK